MIIVNNFPRIRINEIVTLNFAIINHHQHALYLLGFEHDGYHIGDEFVFDAAIANSS